MSKLTIHIALVASFLCILVVPSFAAVQPDAARMIPVLDGGRIKPLDTYAREQVRNIYGKSSIGGQDPLQSIFQWISDPDASAKAELILIDYLPLREKLGLNPGKKRFSLETLRDNAAFGALIEEVRHMPDNEQKKIHKEAGATYHRAMTLSQVLNQDLPLVPPADPHQPWGSPARHDHGVANDEQIHRAMGYWVDMGKAFAMNDQNGFNTAASQFASTTKTMAGSTMVTDTHLKVESWYHVNHPARWAWVLYLLSFLLFVSFSVANKPNLRWIAVTVWLTGFAAHLAALLLRAYISGRAPWSNMYESMQMLAFGIMFFAVFFEFFSKAKVFLPASAVLGVIALVVNDASPFDPFVTPLAPVLKSYWLTFHVMVMMLGYSACALAMGIGHFVLGYEIYKPKDPAQLANLDKALYRTVQIAMLFLVTGIILGAMWANESWGRYWGWDPKETWALITWFFYLAVAHGRFSGWWKRTGTAVLSIVGFPVVLMTYYGVNFFLTGLHSYAGGGSPEPMPPLAWVYLVFETIFLIGYWMMRKKRLSAVA
ncbi:MAG: c-type cytochrome biogenesis protein CcsB [bacterium]|nr:c-type cytochrome biogenesis protein CcsB [bacterium]